MKNYLIIVFFAFFVATYAQDTDNTTKDSNKDCEFNPCFVLEIEPYKEPNNDRDGDGIIDSKDDCPDEAGPLERRGCPTKDLDGDGVLDKDDKCPKVPGVKENNGCPKVIVITKEAKRKLDDYAKTIYFNSGKSSFKPGVTEKLDMIAEIMNEFEDAKFSIDGHTDSDGSNQLNLKLSEKRASAVMNYLIRKGVPSSRLTSRGYGEDYPIATNSTREGKAMNRRTEITLKN